MKRKKLMCSPRDIIDISWVPFFVCQRFGALCHLALVILGVLGLPCAFLPFAPPVVHSHHCCIMSTIGIHNPPHEQQLAVVVLGAAILFFCQWVGDGEGEGAYLAGYPAAWVSWHPVLLSLNETLTSQQSAVMVEMRTFIVT